MNRRAFTVIELLVVIAIIGLLSSVAIVAFNSTRENARLTSGKHFSSMINNSIGSYAIGWWNLNECSGTTANDASGYGNNITLYGGPGWPADSPTDQACSMSLNGSQYGRIVSLNGQPIGNSAVTISAWVKPTDVSSLKTIACLGVDSAGATAYGIALRNLQFTAFFSSYNGIVTGRSLPKVNKWYFVTGVYDGTKNSIYVDGHLDNSVDYSSGNLSAGQASIGLWCGYLSGNNFIGNVGDVKIFASALSAERVHNLYAEQKKFFELASQK